MIDFSIFVAVGIDLKGYKYILSYWTLKDKENLGFWTMVLQDLISRGLSKIAIFITDHFMDLTNSLLSFSRLLIINSALLTSTKISKNKLNLKSTKEIYRIWEAIKEASFPYTKYLEKI